MQKGRVMVSISNSLIACILCFACSGCQKTEISRIYKETQACLPDQTSMSLFDEDLHEFVSQQEYDQRGFQAVQQVTPRELYALEHEEDSL